MGQKLNANYFFLKLFGHSQDIRAKSWGYPAEKSGFPGLQGTYRTFGPHLFTWKTPRGRYPDPKVWVCALFLARYTPLSGPMVYTIFPCYHKEMVFNIAFIALGPRGWATDRERRGATVVMCALFSLTPGLNPAPSLGIGKRHQSSPYPRGPSGTAHKQVGPQMSPQ